MKRIHILVVTLAALVVVGVAAAVPPFKAESGVQMGLQASTPIPTSRSGIWGKSSDGLPKWTKADGTEVAMTASFPLLASDGSAGAPSYSFSGDADTGIYRAGANDIRIVSGGFDVFTSSPTSPRIREGGGNVYFNPDGAQGAIVCSYGTCYTFASMATFTARLDVPDVRITTAPVSAAGGSAAATLGAASTGGAGQPATAAQSGWVKMQDSTGATIWIPFWK